MNFGQAFAALLNGGNVTCPELGRPGSFLGVQEPTGSMTRFIFCQNAAGERAPWRPDEAAMFGKNWSVLQGQANASQAQTEHAGVR
jgi:hypothetical protein